MEKNPHTPWASLFLNLKNRGKHLNEVVKEVKSLEKSDAGAGVRFRDLLTKARGVQRVKGLTDELQVRGCVESEEREGVQGARGLRVDLGRRSAEHS